MTRATPLLLGMLLLVACGSTGWHPRVIVFVSVDTLRSDHLGAYGYPRPTSPFIDGLAERGVLFERSFAPMPTTAPSHASMLTGLYPSQHGVRRNGQRLPDEAVLLTEVLVGAGWEAAGFVSTNAHFSASGLDAGFAHFDEPESVRGKAERSAQRTVGAVVDWLGGRRSTAPLFLFVHLFDPHSPYRPRQPLEPPARERAATATYLLTQQRIDPDFFFGDEALMLEVVTAYDGEIHAVDQAMRALYAAIEARLGLEDSLWILTADHGEGLGNHGWLLHGKKLYNEQLRVPLIFHAPERFLPARVASIAEHVDLLPTLLELAGVEWPGGALPGRSLVPALNGKETAEERFAFAERRTYAEPRRDRGPRPALPAKPSVQDLVHAGIHDNFEPGESYTLQNERYKLIWNTELGRELYDLETDPYETVDLSGQRPEIEAALDQRLRAKLDALRASALTEPVTPVDESSRRALEALGYIDP